MAEDSNTLNLRALRSTHHEPEVIPEPTPAPTQAEPDHHPHLRPWQSTHDAVNDPTAAAIARQRIAALHDVHPLSHAHPLPAAPTTSLITNKHALAERKDLKPSTVSRKVPSFVMPLITAISVFALVLLLFKAPVIFSQVQYNLAPQPSAAPVAVPAGAEAIVPAENSLSIPKINISAPVKYISSVQETDFQKALQDGVVHYASTARPGQNGNVALFGHSSNDWWEPGNYKFVFVLLDKLAPGDQITVDYESKRYVYEVTGSRIVEPTAIEVLNPTATPTLTLITCSPPGTSLRRLVVTARQISPSADASQSTQAPSTNDQAASSLPEQSTGLGTQISNFFNGIAQGIGSLFGGGGSTQPSATPRNNGQPGEIPAIK